MVSAFACDPADAANTPPSLVYIHTHTFNGPFSVTTRMSQYQKGKISLDFTEARDSEWQWHQRGHMQVCISLQTDNHASTPPLKCFTGRMPFLQPNQQHQSTEGRTPPCLVSLESKLLLVAVVHGGTQREAGARVSGVRRDAGVSRRH